MTHGSTPYHLEFTEEMTGWFTSGEHDYRRGFEEGRRQGSDLMFHLTIATDDVHRFMEDPRLFAPARGWVRSSRLGGQHRVERGDFNLFVDEGPSKKKMLYRLLFTDGEGRPLTLSGFKDIVGEQISTSWAETTTLYTRVLRGHVEADGEAGAEIVGSGILRITAPGFARQLTTFRVRGGTPGGRIKALLAFVDLFFGNLWQVFVRRPLRRRG
jgi:cholesterol oxidase